MEREPQPEKMKLALVAAIDYPQATEVLVSFPDRWRFVDYVQREKTALYVGAMPPARERPRRGRFHGLPPELNETLNTYRLYKLFRPWPMPRLSVTWDEATGTGRVDGVHDLQLQLRPIGQAQAWHGTADGVLWECYLHDSARSAAGWQETLAAFWRVVERDIGAVRFFTQPHEPSFEEDYDDFLRELGYGPAYPRWWSKTVGG